MKELDVYFHGFASPMQLGTLADDGKDVLFQYSPAAIEQGVELSPIKLPLRTQAYPDQQSHYTGLQQVPGLLYDSLPDSWGYLLMNRRLKARNIDPNTVSSLDRLAYLGDNTMGALTYAPTTENLADKNDLTLIELATEVQALLVDKSHKVLPELARAGGSPGGARPKALLYYNSLTGQMSTQAERVPSSEPWLIKFPASDDEADSCALEQLYAKIADKCNMGMPQTQFFELNPKLTAFGVKRFDRQGQQRIHIHSLAAMLHANFQIPSIDYEDFFKATRRLTRDNRELKKAVQRCVFNVLMNNRDDHAKNLAFLFDKERAWHLAPPYDLTYCPGYRGEHFMAVNGEGRAPGRMHIIKAAKAAGLSEKDTGLIIDEMLDSVADTQLKSLAKDLPIQPKTVNTVAKAIEQNRKRLQPILNNKTSENKA